MSHDHHHHDHHDLNYNSALGAGIALNTVFVVVEVFYGLSANSSALLADAGHNAGDVLSLVFVWIASWLATKEPFGKYTYGLRKTTILVSILNALLIFGAVIAIGWDAFTKLKTPEHVAGNTMMIVAAIGVIINSLTAWFFMKGQKHDLNIKGAYLHMVADAAISLGVVGAGFAIKYTSYTWIDSVVSMIIIVIILRSSWKLFIDSIDLALDAVPKDIDIEKVNETLLSFKEVTSVHDLHIWAMSTTKVALTAHLVVPEENDNDKLISEIRNELFKIYHISHTTIQIERAFDKDECSLKCVG